MIISYTKKNVNSIALLITTMVLLLAHVSMIQIEQTVQATCTTNLLKEKVIMAENHTKEKSREIPALSEKPKEELQETVEENIWKIEIPKIQLLANINEGTTQAVMAKAVGHFEHTSIWEGNVGLIAHNRGYQMNFFEHLKELQLGDIILYHTSLGTKEYKVMQSIIIQDTDWSYLEPSNENKITLITCVENEPEYRRCIQGIEI